MTHKTIIKDIIGEQTGNEQDNELIKLACSVVW